MRERINDALKQSMKAQDKLRTTTLRMLNAAIKDKDLASKSGKIADAEIVEVLARMIKQRQESADIYRQQNRPDLLEQELKEIEIIRGFQPAQMSEAEVGDAIAAAMAEAGAASVKDMGKVMALLKQKFAGRMDFAKASAAVKARLG